MGIGLGAVERQRVVAVAHGDRLGDLLLGQLELAGDVGGRGRALQKAAELVGGALYEQEALLQAARHVHGPAGVAEVPAQLAEDGGDGERAEGQTPVGVEPLERVEQADVADLDQVVEPVLAGVVAGGEAADEPLVALDERLLGGRVAGLLEPPVQLRGVVAGAFLDVCE